MTNYKAIQHKYLTILLILTAFLPSRLNGQDCDVWACPLGNAMFYDTNLVITVSGDFDQVNFRVVPPVRPKFLYVRKNFLYGAPVDSVPGNIELLEQKLIEERLYLPDEELKELFLRKLAVLIFFEYKQIETLDTRLVETIADLKNDSDLKIAGEASVVDKICRFYMEFSKEKI